MERYISTMFGCHAGKRDLLHCHAGKRDLLHCHAGKRDLLTDIVSDVTQSVATCRIHFFYNFEAEGRPKEGVPE